MLELLKEITQKKDIKPTAGCQCLQAIVHLSFSSFGLVWGIRQAKHVALPTH